MIRQHQRSDTPLQGFKDFEIQRLDRDIAWMREGQRLDPAYLKRCRGDFYRFFSEHDRRRATDFVTTFPEMRAWWNQCEQDAR
jgi:hypothetical protein